MFTVEGIPIPWQRARQNGRRFFTDPKVAAYKELVALRALEAGAKPMEGACLLQVTAIMPIPPSWSKWKQEEARTDRVRPTGKPDWDNLGKGISDALNGVCWVDDSQVVEASVRKFYGDRPCVEVKVYSL